MGGFGDVFAAGVLGAVGGAGSAMAQNALEEQKAQMQAIRDQRLAALKKQEYQDQLTFAQGLKDKAQADQEQKVGDFFKSANPPGTTTSAQDAAEGGGTLTEGQTTPASDLDTATYRYNEALKTGNKGIIDEARARLKDVEAGEDRKTRDKRQDTELDLNRRRTEADEKRADAYIKKTLAPDGKEADPAKVREVKWLADNVFKGDVKKATDMAYGIKNEPRERAIARWAGILKNDYSSGGSNEDVVKRATEIVDKFRAGEDGPKAAPVIDSNRATGTIKKAPDVARPTSKADFDALPSGALWVDPRDGKTYRKP